MAKWGAVGSNTRESEYLSDEKSLLRCKTDDTLGRHTPGLPMENFLAVKDYFRPKALCFISFVRVSSLFTGFPYFTKSNSTGYDHVMLLD